ncbi:MAG: hypothetical protein ACE5HI_02125, partial [bacterium]
YCALLVLQAQVRIVGGEEWALAMNIFLNKKGIEGGLLIEVLIPTVNDQTFAAMATISVNQYAAPLIAVCARLSLNKSLCQNVKLAITGTAKVPQRLHMAEDLLEGKKLTKANIEMIADSVYEKYKPISDPLASEEYRKEVSRLVVKKALTKCLEHSEEAL